MWYLLAASLVGLLQALFFSVCTFPHIYIFSLSLPLHNIFIQGPYSLPLVREMGPAFTSSSCILGVCVVLFSESLTGLPGERLPLFGLIYIATLSTTLSTERSINYTARTVGPSLRDPNRAEWSATNLFFSAIKGQITTFSSGPNCPKSSLTACTLSLRHS
jgi:hypothetical protein